MSMSYISSAKLSGYKSVDDVSINFNPNLNIIIGKNAAGKTNFLNYLNDSLNFRFQGYNNFNSSFILNNEEDIYSFTFSKKTSLNFKDNKSDTLKLKKISTSFIGNLLIERKDGTVGEYGINDTDETDEYFSILEESENFIFKSKLIKHGIPKVYPIIEHPLNLEVLVNGSLSDDFFVQYNSDYLSSFYIKVFVSIINMDLIDGKYFNTRLRSEKSIENFLKDSKSNYKKDILSNLYYLKDLKKVLIDYSPIEDLRLNDNFLIEIDNQNKNLSIKNFYLEFLVDKRWYTFDDLSDGTKRIFYILSEIFTIDLYRDISDKSKLNVIMIEEPELGIHPHQLLKLMSYIKEKSKNIQIIITTHSPITLDILEKNELDSIIIATKLEGKTALKKLDDVKKEKASLYMAELDLSNYWINSDLED